MTFEREKKKKADRQTYGNDGVLHKSLGSDQLVIGRIVDNIKNTCLARDSLRSPGEVTVVQSHRSELEISASASNHVDALGSDLGVRRRTSHHEFTFLTNRFSLTTSVASFVH